MRDILEDAEGAAKRGDTGPGKSNRDRDKPSFPKRFYKSVEVAEADNRFLVHLDGRGVKTPGKVDLALPSKAAADLVAGEWEAVSTDINPMFMPVTRLANTAIDGVANEMQAVLEDIVKYAASDLLCYRAENPQGLVAKQKDAWDPVLDWLSEKTGAELEIGEGIVHIAQPREAIVRFGTRLENHADPFRLACIHTFTSLSGSAILALALAEEALTAEKCWECAHVDEDWNISQWGEDYEASERRAQRWADFEAANRLIRAL